MRLSAATNRFVAQQYVVHAREQRKAVEAALQCLSTSVRAFQAKIVLCDLRKAEQVRRQRIRDEHLAVACKKGIAALGSPRDRQEICICSAEVVNLSVP